MDNPRESNTGEDVSRGIPGFGVDPGEVPDPLGGKMIGMSLALCVEMIIEGKADLEDLAYVYTTSDIENPEADEATMRVNRMSYWDLDPDRGEAIARGLLSEGRVLPFPDCFRKDISYRTLFLTWEEFCQR